MVKIISVILTLLVETISYSIFLSCYHDSCYDEKATPCSVHTNKVQ